MKTLRVGPEEQMLQITCRRCGESRGPVLWSLLIRDQVSIQQCKCFIQICARNGCSNQFESPVRRGRENKHCSHLCANRDRGDRFRESKRKRRSLEDKKVCAADECEETFQTRGKRKRYCSRTCSIRQRKRDQKQEKYQNVISNITSKPPSTAAV